MEWLSLGGEQACTALWVVCQSLTNCYRFSWQPCGGRTVDTRHVALHKLPHDGDYSWSLSADHHIILCSQSTLPRCIISCNSTRNHTCCKIVENEKIGVSRIWKSSWVTYSYQIHQCPFQTRSMNTFIQFKAFNSSQTPFATYSRTGTNSSTHSTLAPRSYQFCSNPPFPCTFGFVVRSQCTKILFAYGRPRLWNMRYEFWTIPIRAGRGFLCLAQTCR